MTTCDAPIVGGFTQEHLLRLYTKAPRAFWRHDVDVSLQAAVRMARFARLAGVRGTFYVMARSEFYNPFSLAGAHAISAIHNAGQRLGVHCDYQEGDIYRAVEREQNMLAVAYPGIFHLHLVSFHMPPSSVLWARFEEFENAYAPEWEDCYVSDSRREWDADKEARVGSDMQIALHPEYWF